MLYDNAQLARVYTHAWQVTQNRFYRRIAEQTLDYVVREMQHPDGGFYSTQDADSEGHEGKFFVWTPDEIRAAAGADAQFAIDAYGVTDRGNFEGKNILFAARDTDVLAAMHKISLAEVDLRLEATRQKLFKAREQRVKPARDEKVLTGWNGLMLAAFAEAARVFKRDDYRAVAERNATFLLREMRPSTPLRSAQDAPSTAQRSGQDADSTVLRSAEDAPSTVLGSAQDARLYRSWKEGRARLNGYLEDYANLAEGLLALYETTFDAKWFTAARECADWMLAHFADPRGGFFDTSDDHEALVTRPKDVQDNAVPSGNAMAATALAKLGAYTGDSRYADAAERALRDVQRALVAAPLGFAQWLCALDFVLGQPKEIAIIGEGEDAQELLDVVWRDYRPNQVVALARPNEVSPILLLQERPQLRNRATAYVCQHFACQMPVTEPEALEEQLSAI